MKKLILILLFFAPFAGFTQAFEGKIIYSNSYKSKMSGMSSEEFTKIMGTWQEYYIKKGNYKSMSNGEVLQWQLYVNSENRVYTKSSNSAVVLWDDASVSKDKLVNATIKKNAATILGRNCHEITLTFKNCVQKSYYDPTLVVDANLFKKHNYGNWYDFLSRTGSMALKTVIESAQFTVETIATEIKPMKLEDKFFTLPKDTKTAKNPN